MSLEAFSQGKLQEMGMYNDMPPKKIKKVPDSGRIVGTIMEFTENDGITKDGNSERIDSIEEQVSDMSDKLDKLINIISDNK